MAEVIEHPSVSNEHWIQRLLAAPDSGAANPSAGWPLAASLQVSRRCPM